MPDFREIVQRHLSGSALDAQTRQEVIEEIADHLTSVYDAHCDEGQAPEQAASLALGQIGNWDAFCKNVIRAKERGVDRIKTVLLPGLAALALTILSDKCLVPAVFYPHLRVFNNYLSTLTDSELVRSVAVVLPWLLTLPLCGATGAYLARRAGASVMRRVAAATLPAWLVMFICGSVFLGRPAPSVLRSYVILLVAVPIALFVGAIPFLRHNTQKELTSLAE